MNYMMKSKLLKSIFMVMLCLSIIVSDRLLTVINAEEKENSIITPNENLDDIKNEGEEIIEFYTPVWNEIEDIKVIYSGQSIIIQEPTYKIGSTEQNRADKVYYRYLSKDGTYDSETPPKDAGEYVVSIEAYIDDYPEYFYKDSVNITIKKATLTISADNKTIKQDENLPMATYSIKGFVNDESENVFISNTLNAIYKSEDTSIEGKYPISMTGEIIANNYDYIFVDGVLDIVKKDMITYPSKNQIEDNYEKNNGDSNKDNSLSVEENPKTGENTNILLYSAMALFSGCGMFFRSGKDSW